MGPPSVEKMVVKDWAVLDPSLQAATLTKGSSLWGRAAS